jgi:spermidine synthase
MQRYGGELIYHGRDEDGVLEVVDTHGVRALHFGTPPRQSALALNNPERLELAYVRAMLCPLPFLGEPRRALLAGLGGGSLAKFLLAEFPACEVVAVERRAKVADLAHDYFGLPRSRRLAVQIADACQWVESMRQEAAQAFDLILVDAYDHLGMDRSVNALDFFESCAALLHGQGALSVNLWGTHPLALRQSTGLLKQCFPGRAFRLAVPNRGNVIGIGLGQDVDLSDPRPANTRARELEFRTGLEMPYFLRNLRPLT